MNTVTKIKKRDGRIVEFDRDKIAEAIFKAAQVLGGRDRDMAEELAIEVEAYLCDKYADKVQWRKYRMQSKRS